MKLVNQYGSGYGWTVEVELEDQETYQDGILALCKAHGLDYDNDEDAEFVHSYGNGVWNQFNW